MSTRTLPQLAVDFNPAKARYPLMGFQKVDGVRGVHVTGGLTGRSMDPFKNSAVVAKFADSCYAGFDGELTIDGLLTNETLEGETLCSLTTGLMNRAKVKKGETALPDNAVWNLFDWLHPMVVDLTYLARYNQLLHLPPAPHTRVLPFIWIENEEQALAWIDKCIKDGFEGAIFRDPEAKHKSGRATEKLNDFWRFKPASDKDAIVLSVEEAMENQNEAKINSLGRTERSAHAENKVGKGMIGCLICHDVETREIIRVGPGAMTHKDRIAMFEDPTLVIDHPIKYRSLDTGVKDAPRQARYVCHRAKEDMS